MESTDTDADIRALVRWVWEPVVLDWTTRVLGGTPLSFTFAEADKLRALNTENAWFDPTQIGHRACLYYDFTASCVHLLRLFRQLHDNITGQSPNRILLDQHLLAPDGKRWSDDRDLSWPIDPPMNPPLNPPGAVELCAKEMERMKCEPLAIIRCLEYGLTRCVALRARLQTLTNNKQAQFAIARGHWSNAFVPGEAVSHSLEICAQTPLAYAQPIQADMNVGPKAHDGFGGPVAVYLNRITSLGVAAIALDGPLVEGQFTEASNAKKSKSKVPVPVVAVAPVPVAPVPVVPSPAVSGVPVDPVVPRVPVIPTEPARSSSPLSLRIETSESNDDAKTPRRATPTSASSSWADSARSFGKRAIHAISEAGRRVARRALSLTNAKQRDSRSRQIPTRTNTGATRQSRRQQHQQAINSTPLVMQSSKPTNPKLKPITIDKIAGQTAVPLGKFAQDYAHVREHGAADIEAFTAESEPTETEVVNPETEVMKPMETVDRTDSTASPALEAVNGDADEMGAQQRIAVGNLPDESNVANDTTNANADATETAEAATNRAKINADLVRELRRRIKEFAVSDAVDFYERHTNSDVQKAVADEYDSMLTAQEVVQELNDAAENGDIHIFNETAGRVVTTLKPFIDAPVDEIIAKAQAKFPTKKDNIRAPGTKQTISTASVYDITGDIAKLKEALATKNVPVIRAIIKDINDNSGEIPDTLIAETNNLVVKHNTAVKLLKTAAEQLGAAGGDYRDAVERARTAIEEVGNARMKEKLEQAIRQRYERDGTPSSGSTIESTVAQPDLDETMLKKLERLAGTWKYIKARRAVDDPVYIAKEWSKFEESIRNAVERNPQWKYLLRDMNDLNSLTAESYATSAKRTASQLRWTTNPNALKDAEIRAISQLLRKGLYGSFHGYNDKAHKAAVDAWLRFADDGDTKLEPDRATYATLIRNANESNEQQLIPLLLTHLSKPPPSVQRQPPGYFSLLFGASASTHRFQPTIEHVDRAQLLVALATLPPSNPLHWCGNLSWAFMQSGLALKCRERYAELCRLWAERRNKQT